VIDEARQSEQAQKDKWQTKVDAEKANVANGTDGEDAGTQGAAAEEASVAEEEAAANFIADVEAQETTPQKPDDQKVAELIARLAALKEEKKQAKRRGRVHAAKAKTEDQALRKETGKGVSDLRQANVDAQAAERRSRSAAEAVRKAASRERVAIEKLESAKVQEESARTHEKALTQKHSIDGDGARHAAGHREGWTTETRGRDIGDAGGGRRPAYRPPSGPPDHDFYHPGPSYRPSPGPSYSYTPYNPPSPGSTSNGGSRAENPWNHFTSNVWEAGSGSRAEMSAAYASWKCEGGGGS